MLFINTLQQTLIFLPLAFGVYLSYEILMITDLTVEGTFVLGAAIFAKLITSHFTQIESVIGALLGGALVGIAAVFMLYSVNFGVMGQPNISLLNNTIFLQYLQNNAPTILTIFLILFALLLAFLLFLFLHSKTGLLLRAFGSNPHLLRKLGKKPAIYLGLGLAISNMLSALCGVMTAQLSGYADIHMGLGMALTAIGDVVIGKKIASVLFSRHNRFSAAIGLFGCLLGAFIYYLIVNGLLMLGVDPIYLRLVLGLVLVAFLSTAHYTKQRGELYATAD